MLAYQFGHFKHRYLWLAAKNSFELFISIDVTLVLAILETVLFDIGPDFFWLLPIEASDLLPRLLQARRLLSSAS